MEFNGQRHGPAFRLRWSPQQRQDDDLIGRRRRPLEAAEAFRDEGTEAVEVTGGKGDINKRTYLPIFLLTNGWKPIIISSFRRVLSEG